MPGGIDSDAAIRAVLAPSEQVLWHSHPGAGRLFVSVVPRLLRNIVFLAVTAFAIYAGWQETQMPARVLCVLIALLLIYLSIAALREGIAAGVSHYLVTDRRIIRLTPRAGQKLFVILPRVRGDMEKRHSSNCLSGTPTIGRIGAGRATIAIPYDEWRSRSINNYPDKVYRTRTVRMYAVAEPARAVEAIAQMRRRN
jgi:hypothetical protein